MLQKIKELRERNAAIHKEMEALNKQNGGRFGRGQQSKWDELDSEFESNRVEIRRLEHLVERDADLSKVRRAPVVSDPEADVRHTSNADRYAPRLVDASGREMRLYSPEERLVDFADTPRGNPWEFIAASVRGDSRRIAELRDLSGVLESAGGYLIDGVQTLDLARNQSSVVRAGARTFMMESAELVVAKVTGDATGYWRAENAAITSSDLAFAGVTFRARTLGILVKMPLELAQDAPNAPSLIEQALAAAIALELDRAGLRGDGAGEEPLGLRYSSSVPSSALSGAPDYDDLSTAVSDIQAANGMPTAYIVSAREAGTLDRLKASGSGEYLMPPASVQALRKLVSNQIPTDLGGGSDSEIYVGDFAQLWIGMRSEIQIQASREASDSSSSAFKNAQLWIRALLRADVAVMRPTHFKILTAVTT